MATTTTDPKTATEMPKEPGADNLPTVPASKLGGNVPMVAIGTGFHLQPRTTGEAIEFAQMMSKASAAVRPAFRGNPGMCLAVAMQAWRWDMDPFAVAQKAYVTRSKGGDENVAYEAQLIAAVVNVRGPFIQRPRIAFEGEGENMFARVSATIRGETEPRTLKTPPIKKITPRNSPLWQSDPEQQLSYYALRAFGRRHAPEVLLGVYTPEESEAGFALPAPQGHAEVLPPPAKREREPRREDFKPKAGAPQDGVEEIDPEAEAEADRQARAAQRAAQGQSHDPETGEVDDEGKTALAGTHEAQGSAVAADQAGGHQPPKASAIDPQSDTFDDDVSDVGTEANAAPADQGAAQVHQSEEEAAAEARQRDAEAMERQAISNCEAMVDRAMASLAEWKTIAELREFVSRVKTAIETAERVPAIERGRLRAQFQGQALARERELERANRGGRK